MEFQKDHYLPVIPGRNVVVFPGRSLPLSIGRKKSIAAVEKVAASTPWLITIAQTRDTPGKGEKPDEVTAADLNRVGTLCKVEAVRGTAEQGGFQIIVRGVSRVKITDLREHGGMLEATFEDLADLQDCDEQTSKALTVSMKTLALEILQLVPADTRQLAELVEGVDDLSLLTHLSAEHLDIPLQKKQEILETVSLKHRALSVLELMNEQKQSLELQSTIREKLSRKMGKLQRETILREQLKAIREELGESGSKGDGDGDDYSRKIEDAHMPEEAKKIALEEARRLESIGSGSPESHVIRNYLDLLCAMPWDKASEDVLDLEAARAVLESDHYGLEKIKKRIIQHLAVMKLKQSGRGSILLFVGPPGVGKTSLGQSIAKALGRKFVRASLGGVRDEADIRGHRRTYIGAMPGRIVQGIKRAGVINPVFLLDEIDKMGRGFAGDPSGALLEVLDPEQNSTFSDHYLDVPFDLSKVFFIATANSLETIPAPLLDRLEVIDLSGYTSPEKLHIAKHHLVPKVLADHGLTTAQVEFSDAALMRVITHYTREAGVRELQRKLSELCRALTEKVLAPNVSLPIKVEIASLEELVGHERFIHEVAERIMPPGVTTGLAWTPAGGDILFIESSLMPGTNQLILTGQLGDIMKESARIALSLVRSHLPTMVPGFDYSQKDIHIHVPAGAIPKDGPSAGVTMLTSLASLFSGRSVSPTLAMTGEVTLRGAVMPVGGIKEKVLAAHRAGIETILMSRRNEKDLKDVPDDVKAQLKFEFVDTVADVLKTALGLEAMPMTGAPAAALITPSLEKGAHPVGLA